MNRLQHAGAAGSSDRPHAEWLDDHLEVRGHRQGYEARSFPDLFAARLPRVSRGATLDLFCGTGRHVMFPGDRQPVVGLDLSPWLPDAARTSLPGTPLVRADMRRLPFRDAAFTLVVNLFMSSAASARTRTTRRC